MVYVHVTGVSEFRKHVSSLQSVAWVSLHTRFLALPFVQLGSFIYSNTWRRKRRERRGRERVRVSGG